MLIDWRAKDGAKIQATIAGQESYKGDKLILVW
jgi:hypothetical protein